MNQGRIWCVVHPTVGLPLFLGSVALTSLAVHTAVMTHTTWMSNYWQGAARAKVASNGTGPAVAALASNAQPAFVITVAPALGNAEKGASFVVNVAPNGAPNGVAQAAAAQATIEPPVQQTASLSPDVLTGAKPK